jgi:hypothetical protein
MSIRLAVMAAAVSLTWASAPAFADCAEEVEGFQLAALQNGLAKADDPTTTPEARGMAAYGKTVREYLTEASAAAAAGNEKQCLDVLAVARKMNPNQ